MNEMDDITITATIWCIWINQVTGEFKPVRRVLRGVSWFERSISTAIQTGGVLQNPATIRVFAETSGLTYIPPHEWLALPINELDGLWTCDLTQSAKPNIAPFESDMEFAYGTSGQVATALNNFRRDTPGVLQIMERNDNSRGDGAHIRMGARA